MGYHRVQCQSLGTQAVTGYRDWTQYTWAVTMYRDCHSVQGLSLGTGAVTVYRFVTWHMDFHSV